MKFSRIFGAAAAAFALAAIAAPIASAHVTANVVGDAVKGGYTVINFRVPNEEASDDTTKVEVKFPAGIGGASIKPVAGWTAKVTMKKLDTPIKTDDGEMTEGVDTITWTGGKVAPGEFQEFPVSLKLPDASEDGDSLYFPTLQTYSDDSVVKWIGKGEDADKPAPHLTLVDAAAGGGHDAMTAADSKDDAGKGDDSDKSDSADSDDVDSARMVGMIGIGVGALGVLLGLIALGRSGRRKS